MATDQPSSDRLPETIGFRWTPSSMRLALVLILLAGHSAFWIQPSADPPLGRGIESRLLADGLAPLDAARYLSGEPGAPPAGLGAPFVTLPAAAVFSAVGVRIGATKVLAGLSTLIFAMLGAVLLWRRYGDAIGILGAILFIFHGASFAWGRSPTVIPLVQLSALAIVLVAARRERTAPWLALCLTSIASVLVHPTIWFVAPALILEGLGRLTPVRRGFARMPFPAMVMASGVAIGCALSIPLGLRTSLVTTFLGGEGSHGPALLAVVPAVLPFAWYGFLIFLTHARGSRGGPRSVERLLHGIVWIPLAIRLSVGSVDAAACAELLPFIIWLALAAIGSERTRELRRRLPLFGARGAFFCFAGALGTLWVASEARGLLADPGAVTLGLPLPLVGLGLIFAFGLPRERRLGPHLLTALAALVLVVPGLWESAKVLGHPEFNLARVNEELDGTLLPTAELGGEWARAMTLSNGVPWTTANGGELPPTHRVHDAAEEVGSLDLEEFLLLGHHLEISRLDPDRGAWSAFEEGRDEERRGRNREARFRYFLILRGDPDHSPSWQRIAKTLIEEGDGKNGYRCLLNALHGAPGSAAVQEGLARLYLEQEHDLEAEYHLERAGSAGADPKELAPLWERITEDRLR